MSSATRSRVLVGQIGRVEVPDRVAVARHPVHRLAETLHLAALEGEVPEVDDRFVADVDEAHSRRLIGRQPLLPGAHHTESPAVAVDEASERVPDVRPFGEGSDRVGRDQADAAEHGVGDEGVAMEEPLLVVAQSEVVERPRSVPSHDVAGAELGGAPPDERPSRRQPPVHDRAGQEVERHDDERDADGKEADRGEAVDRRWEADPAHTHQAFERASQDVGP